MKPIERLATKADPPHLLVAGKTRCGKTTLIKEILEVKRRHGEKSVIFDWRGEYRGVADLTVEVSQGHPFPVSASAPLAWLLAATLAPEEGTGIAGRVMQQVMKQAVPPAQLLEKLASLSRADRITDAVARRAVLLKQYICIAGSDPLTNFVSGGLRERVVAIDLSGITDRFARLSIQNFLTAYLLHLVEQLKPQDSITVVLEEADVASELGLRFLRWLLRDAAALKMKLILHCHELPRELPLSDFTLILGPMAGATYVMPLRVPRLMKNFEFIVHEASDIWMFKLKLPKKPSK